MRWLPIVLLAACDPEYGVEKVVEPENACDADPSPGGELWVDEACADQGVADDSEVAVAEEWSFASLAVSDLLAAPIVVPLDGDDVPEIVVTSTTGYVTALHGDGSGVLWQTELDLQGNTSPAAADLDGDGDIEVVVLEPSAAVLLDHTGQVLWRTPLPENYAWSDAQPAVADFEGDGQGEILVGGHVLRADGSVRAVVDARGGDLNGFAPLAADLDGDGVQELVTGNSAWTADGELLWETDYVDGIYPRIDAFPAVADLDGDGDPEVVAAGNGRVRAMAHTGELLWEIELPYYGSSLPVGGGPVAIADATGDGRPEILVASREHVFLLDGDGEVVWWRDSADGSARTGAAAFDIDADGFAEMVYAGEHRIRLLSGTGVDRWADVDHDSRTALEYPVVADVDADGEAEIVVPRSREQKGLLVLGGTGWPAATPIWHQHAFQRGTVTADGRLLVAQPWTTHNTFRAGHMGHGFGADLADLQLQAGEVCELECDAGRVVVQLHVGNTGAGTLGSSIELQLSAFVGDTEHALAPQTLEVTVAPGRLADSVQVTIEDVPPGADAIVVRAAAQQPECHPDDDELVISGPFCAGE